MITFTPYEKSHPDLKLKVHGYWEIGEIHLTWYKSGKMTNYAAIPIHILEDVIKAMQAEKLYMDQQDKQFEEWCDEQEKNALNTEPEEIPWKF